MIRRVRVTTGARLHFGPLAVGATHGRTFGGVGLMIDAPGWQVTVERSDVDGTAAGPQADRVSGILERFRAHSATPLPSCLVSVIRHMPPHAGLGSGTQLALAVARGLATQTGEANPDVAELSRRTERGQRSAIGTYGFASGGFLVDAGRPVDGGLGELACRLATPTRWRFLLASPQQRSGLSGAAERRAFQSLPPMPTAMTAELCRTVVMDWLPAVRCEDFAAFCASLDTYGALVGEYFGPVQGGIFADRTMTALAAELAADGIRGIAQSSWGPTIAVCCADADAAERLRARLADDHRWSGCAFQIVRPLNEGARVTVD